MPENVSRTCEACGRPMPKRTGRGRPPRYCSDSCKDKAKRARAYSRAADGAEPENAENSDKPTGKPKRKRRTAAATATVRGQLLAVVTRELDEHGRTDTVDGQQAIQLATVLSGWFATATGLAGLSQELSRVMDRALAGTQHAGDPVDELRKLREEKIAAIRGRESGTA